MRSVWRRTERIVLGFVFGVIAFVVERRVLRAIKKGALSDERKESGLTATGGAQGLSVTPD